LRRLADPLPTTAANAIFDRATGHQPVGPGQHKARVAAELLCGLSAGAWRWPLAGHGSAQKLVGAMPPSPPTVNKDGMANRAHGGPETVVLRRARAYCCKNSAVYPSKSLDS
jgi:hypothetical protein